VIWVLVSAISPRITSSPVTRNSTAGAVMSEEALLHEQGAQVRTSAQTPANRSSSTTPAPFFQRGSRSKMRAGQGLKTSQMRKRTNPVIAAKALRGRRTW